MVLKLETQFILPMKPGKAFSITSILDPVIILLIQLLKIIQEGFGVSSKQDKCCLLYINIMLILC